MSWLLTKRRGLITHRALLSSPARMSLPSCPLPLSSKPACAPGSAQNDALPVEPGCVSITHTTPSRIVRPLCVHTHEHNNAVSMIPTNLRNDSDTRAREVCICLLRLARRPPLGAKRLPTSVDGSRSRRWPRPRPSPRRPVHAAWTCGTGGRKFLPPPSRHVRACPRLSFWVEKLPSSFEFCVLPPLHRFLVPWAPHCLFLSSVLFRPWLRRHQKPRSRRTDVTRRAAERHEIVQNAAMPSKSSSKGAYPPLASRTR